MKRSERRDFAGAVRGTVSFYEMDLSRPLLLVSGGPDSVALLRVVRDLGCEPFVLHFDHGLRAEESEADAEFTRSLCEKLGVRCEVRRVELSGSSSGLQERAREERYRISVEVADELGCSSIATGHTADDAAETVLMNLARGSGLRGLSGIPPARKFGRTRIVRPVIERTREEILSYLELLDQSYRTDSSNLTIKYSRNRIRLEAMPLLEEMHPGASRNISRASRLLREDLEALEHASSVALERREGEVVVILERLEGLHHAFLRHAVRQAYEEAAAPDASPLEHSLVQSVLDLTRRKQGTRTLDLPGGVVAAVRFGREVSFYKPADSVELEAVELSPGEVSFAEWKVSVLDGAVFDAKDAARVEIAYLDIKKGPYWVRLVREGDIIRPLGLGGTKKVLRAMMDRKVPRDLRRKTPIVVNGEGKVAWVFLGELGEEFAVWETEKAIRLEARRP